MFSGAYGDACTHVKLAPQTLYSLAQDRLIGPVSEQGGNALRQPTFLPPFLLCYWSLRMVRLYSPII